VGVGVVVGVAVVGVAVTEGDDVATVGVMLVDCEGGGACPEPFVKRSVIKVPARAKAPVIQATFMAASF
jgi:hypothetical protein